MNRKKLLALVLLVALAAALFVACGEPDPMEQAAGTYVGQYTKLVGDETRQEETFRLELKQDGTGVHARNEMEFKVTWTLEGETFTMHETFLGMSIDYTGTLAEGKLDIFNGDPTDIWTYEYVYQKQ